MLWFNLCSAQTWKISLEFVLSARAGLAEALAFTCRCYCRSPGSEYSLFPKPLRSKGASGNVPQIPWGVTTWISEYSLIKCRVTGVWVVSVYRVSIQNHLIFLVEIWVWAEKLACRSKTKPGLLLCCSLLLPLVNWSSICGAVWESRWWEPSTWKARLEEEERRILMRIP